MVFHAILKKLKRIGIEVSPYYIVTEGFVDNNTMNIVPKFSTSTPDFLTKEEINFLENDSEILITPELDEKSKCFALRHNSQIIAASWCKFDKFEIFNKSFTLQYDEAYLHGASTLKKYRGKNLAPYIRVQLYKRLFEMGYTKIYSYTEVFNTSAMKFKKKLGATPKELYLYINLWGKFNKTILIKRYIFS